MLFSPRLQLFPGVFAIICLIAGGKVSAQEAESALKLFRSGQYAPCIEACSKSIEANDRDEESWLVKLRAQLVTGQYEEALTTYESARASIPRSIQLLLVGCDVLRANDRPKDALANIESIVQMASNDPFRYGSATDRVTIGRTLLLGRIDAKQVLEQIYDRVKRQSPESPEPYMASAELALTKSDFALAAEGFQEAAKRSPDDPDIYLGLARAYENDSERGSAALATALALNPRHVDSLLLRADNAIDRESYDEAEKLIRDVLRINPKHPRAWAYFAVISHLAGNSATERESRDQALASWKTNPEVDHLIGAKLSQKYRFAEGEALQRQALSFDPTYVPAKVQLCQDLLRLGKEDEGWKLADEIFKEDPYDVVAYNLVTLRDHIAKFRSIENERFLVRMEAREAQIYGRRVLDLLTRAKAQLCAKYDVQLPEKVTVEIFPQQKDFAIRTFGIPGGAGFLGVCFGNVVTVNSPASRASHPSNWEAVVWHEFCHVVTLSKTLNKMPRWLSEGISVYEERQANPAWGQRMSPQYRELILEDGATPVSELSGAFLKPKSPMHLMFAYYESSMVVQYVIERFGLDAIKAVLDDLAKDVSINEALAKRTEPIEALDESFAKWLRTQAENLAPGADLERPKLPLDADSETLAAWNEEHPNNFWGLLGQGQSLIATQKWNEAKVPLEKAAALYPDYAEAGGPYLLLAAAHRGLNETDAEREMLEKHIALNADAMESRLRLLELVKSEKDWRAVRDIAEQVLAINPLVPAPHRYLSEAAEALGERALSIESRRTSLLMDPLDLAEQHYRLAKLLVEDQQLVPAKQEVIRALEEAPRFRQAHRLLLDIVTKLDELPAPAAAPATNAAGVSP